MQEQTHVPVLMQQVMSGLAVKPDGVYWDGTFGRGGHSAAILAALSPKGRLIASDRDAAARESAQRFKEDPRFKFIFGALDEVMPQIPDSIDGFLWDLGVSTPQLKDAERGFSFKENGPLDMRMDQTQGPTGADLVNDTPEKELADLIYKYGEERLSRRIARFIVEERLRGPIQDTDTLAAICRRAYPKKYHRIDPATRTFQALRIAVNDELGQLENTLPIAMKRLGSEGRAVVISFHSLEDRIVKHMFRDAARAGWAKLITKRPLVAEDDERDENPASRSAKLRILEITNPGEQT